MSELPVACPPVACPRPSTLTLQLLFISAPAEISENMILFLVLQYLSNASEAEADTQGNIRVLSELKAALRTQPIK